ncbi:FKBP-type peptidyl-prolyl cis-trans isomerase [Myroides sp. LJL115]
MDNLFKYCLLFLGVLSLASCKEKQQPRPIIAQNSGHILAESMQRNADLTQEQQELFLNYIQKHSKEQYNHNQKGFYYTYLQRHIKDSIVAKPGDRILFSYQVSDLKDSIIYSFDEIGSRYYIMDKEEILPVLRQSLKFMKQKEVIKVLVPSELAYSYLGDTNKISKNQPLLFTIVLQSIQN